MSSSYRARIVWTRDPADIGRAISDLGERVSSSMLVSYLERQAPRIRQQMQQEAPWADKTGEARRKLSAEVEQTGQQISLYLSHGVSYGKWLELSNGGRYAIVGPTTMKAGWSIMQGMTGLIERQGGRAGGGWQSW